MTMLRLPGALLLLVLAVGSGAHAETRQARFVVRVTVPALATIEAVEQPARLHLSAEDVARGYKHVTARYVVDSNSRRGFLLRLTQRLGLTQHIAVDGLSVPVVLREQTVEVYQPHAGEPQDLALDYRLVLEPHARPGSYELPVHLSATPL